MSETLSRRLSFILRHKLESIGVHLVEYYGWANVNELLNKLNILKETLEEIVKTDNKQRYSFDEIKTKMRVNQSHSIKVDVELKELEPPKFLYYGTDEKYLVDILQMGIIKKSRLYVHLSETIETAINVGKRHGIPKVLIIVQAQKMFQDGYKFYLSENNVWLTDNVPKEYIWMGV